METHGLHVDLPSRVLVRLVLQGVASTVFVLSVGILLGRYIR